MPTAVTRSQVLHMYVSVFGGNAYMPASCDADSAQDDDDDARDVPCRRRPPTDFIALSECLVRIQTLEPGCSEILSDTACLSSSSAVPRVRNDYWY